MKQEFQIPLLRTDKMSFNIRQLDKLIQDIIYEFPLYHEFCKMKLLNAVMKNPNNCFENKG